MRVILSEKSLAWTVGEEPKSCCEVRGINNGSLAELCLRLSRNVKLLFPTAAAAARAAARAQGSGEGSSKGGGEGSGEGSGGGSERFVEGVRVRVGGQGCGLGGKEVDPPEERTSSARGDFFERKCPESMRWGHVPHGPAPEPGRSRRGHGAAVGYSGRRSLTERLPSRQPVPVLCIGLVALTVAQCACCW